MEYIVCVLTVVPWILPYTVCSPDCCTITSEAEEVHVSCRGCGLDSVPEDLPLNTSFLDLSNNRITTLKEKPFLHLRHLNNLSLASNGLSHISSEAFDGLHQLYCLDMNDNALNASMPVSIFKTLLNLKVLNLQRNYFHIKRAYPTKALSALWNIETLYIDIFEGFHFGKGFLNLTKLKNLEFFGIKERISLRNSSFAGLAKSNISSLSLIIRIGQIEKGTLFPFRNLRILVLDSRRHLDIVTVLPVLHALQNKTMNSITLSHNYIKFTESRLLISDIIYIKSICVENISLVYNGIESISTNAMVLWNSNKCLKVLDLSWNRFHSPVLVLLLPLLPSLTHIYASYMKRRIVRRSFNEVKYIFLPKNLIYMNFSHDNMRGIMENITIVNGNNLDVLDVSYPQTVLECSGAQYKGLNQLKEVYISGIDCSQPNPNMFSNMHDLYRIEARKCNLGSRLAVNTTSLFKGLFKLAIVDISENEIQQLHTGLFIDQAESLKQILISENRMAHLPASFLETQDSLELLDLSHNVITMLQKTECSVLDTMKTKSDRFIVKLTGNPFVCNCDNLDFIRWMDRTDVVYDKNNIQCVTADGSRVTFGTLLEDLHSFQASCVSRFWLIVSVTLLILITVFGTVSVILWRYSIKLRVWCRRPKEHGFKYDVFLSYSHKDSGWIAKTLVPMLEQEGIRYCCYDKDFDPGKDIADNILDAIDCSRKVLFVVTYNFIHSEWATYEMGLTSMYAFRDGREDMNILVFLEDIKRSEMPKVMRRIWDTVVCLEWPNERNTHEDEIKTRRQKFYRKVTKCLRNGNACYVSPVSESTL